MRARGLRAAVLAAVVFAGGCNSNPVIPDGVVRSQITIAVTPSPLIPVAQLPPSYSLSYKITIAEVAGLGGELQYVNGTVFDAGSGIALGANNFDSKDLTVFVGSKRVEANKSLEVNQQIAYQLPTASTGVILTINVQFKDDHGNFVTASILVHPS